jgi:NADH-quinone oxidoreductase subunit J
VVGAWTLSPELLKVVAAPVPAPGTLSNTEAIGLLLYTRYLFYFQAAGLILLIAMVGAIVLTLRHKAGVRRQSVAQQVARDPASAIEVRHVTPGQGI